MRIGIVDQSFFPRDRARRVRKIVETPAEAGHLVVVVCRNNRGNPVFEMLGPRTCVYRFGESSDNNLAYILSYPTPFNVLWAWWIYKVARKEKLEALVVANLRLAIPTWLAARLAGTPVIFDMVEYFPTMSLLHKGRANPIKRLLKHPATIRLMERLTVHLVDHICVVVEEQKQRLLRLGVPEEHISIVSNTPSVNGEDDTQLQVYHTFRPGNEFRLIYVGLVVKGRGLDLILRALQHIKKWGDTKPFVKFLVVGDGDELPKLQELAHELGVEDGVDFLGWRSPQEIPAFLRQSQVGVIPHIVSDFWNNTIPNKLFDYMLCGLPVLGTQTGPVQRVIETEECGVVVSEQPQEVAEAIVELKNNVESLHKMGCRGRQAILNKYNWKQDGAIFLRTLCQVVENREQR